MLVPVPSPVLVPVPSPALMSVPWLLQLFARSYKYHKELQVVQVATQDCLYLSLSEDMYLMDGRMNE